MFGRFQVGYRLVEFYAMPYSTGGWFNLVANGDRWPEIHIGMDHGCAEASHAVLTHEVMEMCLQDNHAAFQPKAFVDSASDCYQFIFNHNQFTQIAAATSYAILESYKDFHEAWNKCREIRAPLKPEYDI